jgi:putative ABC transport system permease protein
MNTLWAASIRHLLRHPAQLALALLGLALGVGTIIAVDIATASSGRAFELSMDAVNGAATHEIRGGPGGVDETLYVRLKTSGISIALTPVVEGYVDVGDETLQLVGIDPLIDASVRGDSRLSSASRQEGEINTESGDGAATGAAVAPAGGGASAGSGKPAGDGANPARAGAESERGRRAAGRDGLESITLWLTEPGAAVMAASTAQRLGLRVDDDFNLRIGGTVRKGKLIGTLGGSGSGFDTLLLSDISQAQEWLGLYGRLSRIDVRAPAGPEGEQALKRLQALLPEGLLLQPAERRTKQSLDMTAAFTTNLQAMSLLALLVGVFLIFSAVSFAVVQRRRVIGVLRALGATRGRVLAMILIEALMLGIVGAGLGLVLGTFIGRELVALVSRTINDLYFVVAVNDVIIPGLAIAKAVGAGIGVALFAAAVPAIEVANSAPSLGLRRSVIETRAVSASRWLVGVSVVLAVAAGVIVLFSTRSLLAGFIALFLLLLTVAAITPAVLRGMALAASHFVGRFSPNARLASGDIAASLSRTGVAVAALGLAIASMIGVSIMVESFRESLRTYLARTIRADLYITAQGPGFGRPERRIEPDVLRDILALPVIAEHTESRRVIVDSDRGPIRVDALRVVAASREALPLTIGDSATTWAKFEQGGVIVSEPLAWHLQLNVGDRLKLHTADGERPFEVAGVYREYGNDQGSMLMNRAVYSRLWHDDAVTAIGIYLKPGTDPPTAKTLVREALRHRQSLAMTSNYEVRAISMRIFERTFVITRVLYWLTAGVAAIGLISALLAWELERSRELAIVRALGLTPRGAGGLIEVQTGFMGFVAFLAAIPAGVLTAVLLITVINRRAFGWQIDFHITAQQFVNAFAVAMIAALVAGLYPAWRMSRAPLASDIREE